MGKDEMGWWAVGIIGPFKGPSSVFPPGGKWFFLLDICGEETEGRGTENYKSPPPPLRKKALHVCK